jgi:maltose-binding protein MalE
MAGVTSASADETNLPLDERLKRAQWAAAPFPSAVPGLENVAYAPFDILVIPKGAKHKREAFEFIAYVNRQDVIEKLCSMHCKNSPLSSVSQNFLEHHKNPYVKVFEDLANSPNARALPQIPIWREVADELGNAVQRMVLLEAEPIDALRDSQQRLQAKYDDFMGKQRARKGSIR